MEIAVDVWNLVLNYSWQLLTSTGCTDMEGVAKEFHYKQLRGILSQTCHERLPCPRHNICPISCKPYHVFFVRGVPVGKRLDNVLIQSLYTRILNWEQVEESIHDAIFVEHPRYQAEMLAATDIS